eukprot:364350-Chlamydomonas_euryale.AAC.4
MRGARGDGSHWIVSRPGALRKKDKTDRDRPKQTETDQKRQRQTKTDRDRPKEAETDQNRQRQTKRGRDRSKRPAIRGQAAWHGELPPNFLPCVLFPTWPHPQCLLGHPPNAPLAPPPNTPSATPPTLPRPHPKRPLGHPKTNHSSMDAPFPSPSSNSNLVHGRSLS